MQCTSFLKAIRFDRERIGITPMLESESSKEVRIVMCQGQVMKEHKTAFPIAVMVLKGTIRFTLPGEEEQILHTGDLITLEAHVPHSLSAMEDAVVRLTLHKRDSIARVNAVLTR